MPQAIDAAMTDPGDLTDVAENGHDVVADRQALDRYLAAVRQDVGAGAIARRCREYEVA